MILIVYRNDLFIGAIFVMRLAGFLICLWFGPAWLSAAESNQAEFFESKVRPLLAGNCYACHTDAKSGGLRLDSRESILQGGNSGPAIAPGDPEGSLLIQAVSHRHDRLRMPPPGKLEPHEIGYLVEWVQSGAVWPVSKQEFFAKRIRPLIEQNCLACHGENPQGGAAAGLARSFAERRRLRTASRRWKAGGEPADQERAL